MYTRRSRANNVSTCDETFELTTFGEALFRYLPATESKALQEKHADVKLPAGCEVFVRTLAGAELNVSVALAHLGMTTTWASVLPEGPLGNRAVGEIKQHGVDVRWCIQTPNSEVGVIHVLPEKKTVTYQRSNSAFARLKASMFDWFSVAKCSRWIHLTGITPMLGQAPRAAWAALIQEGNDMEVPVSLDLNHRPALSSLDELMYVVTPYLHLLQVLILSRTSAVQLVRKLVASAVNIPDNEVLEKTSVVADLRTALQCPVLAIACSELHEDTNEQTRWSVVANATCVVTTKGEACRYSVVEKIGGGDAWVAGFLHSVLSTGNPTEALGDGGVLKRSAVRGDLLASLTQQELGDFSSVTLEQLQAAEGGS